MTYLFTQELLNWYEKHGRHDLPWQRDPTPYRVWISEIMLQQTQVTTVIPYYQRFIERFSSIKLLANAHQDEVLSYWSGLGYYARARHLHRCAQIIHQQHQDQFPTTVEQISELPGIGRSTAGAILSFGLNLRAPILDGNVKRVLTRYHAIEGSPTKSAVLQRLWQLSEQLTPTTQHEKYNQAIMDLGATVCTRSKPACPRCPMMNHCQAYAQSKTHEFPNKKAPSKRGQKSVRMLIIQDAHQAILLEKRPPTGIWGGLWSFPECDLDQDMTVWCRQYLGGNLLTQQQWPVLYHQFSHFELAIHPTLLTIALPGTGQVMESTTRVWYKAPTSLPGGIAAPIAKLLEQLGENT